MSTPSHTRQTQIVIVITPVGGTNYIFPKLNMILPKKKITIQDFTNNK